MALLSIILSEVQKMMRVRLTVNIIQRCCVYLGTCVILNDTTANLSTDYFVLNYFIVEQRISKHVEFNLIQHPQRATDASLQTLDPDFKTVW